MTYDWCENVSPSGARHIADRLPDGLCVTCAPIYTPRSFVDAVMNPDPDPES